MFHRYIRAGSGRKVDFDRAKWLMDRGLLASAWKNTMRDAEKIADGINEELTEFAIARGVAPPPQLPASEEDLLGEVWSAYCEAHYLKYGELFEPDVSSSWDA